jgi:ATP-dependent DNA helicase DinG
MTCGEAVERVFGPDGALARAGREVRAGQLAVARAAAQCFDERRAGMLEGPPGTGKTFAYLTPALAAALEGKRTVIAVSTNALLDQIAADIPRLAELLGARVPFAKLKGRSHYVCPLNADRSTEVRRRPDLFRLYPDDAAQLDRVLAWQGGGGVDLTQFPEKLAGRVRGLVTMAGDACRTQRFGAEGCEYDEADEDAPGGARELRCPFLLARRAAQDAAIVVTNYDLLVLNYRLNGAIFGQFDALVLDEAHELNAKVRDAFAEQRGPSAFQDVAEALLELAQVGVMRELPPDATDAARVAAREARVARARATAQALRDAATGLFDAAATWARDRAEAPRDGEPGDAREIEVLLGPAHGLDGAALEAAAIEAHNLGAEFGAQGGTHGEAAKTDARKPAALLAGWLRGDDPNLARWVRVDDQGRVALHVAPVDVAPYLTATIHSRPIARVAVSATLTPDGTWAHPRAQLAMPDDALTCVAPSPFDFARQAAWFTPRDMPRPAAGGRAREVYNRAAAGVAARLVGAVGGRALVLCSARRDVPVAAAALRPLGYEVLVQGELPPAELARRFKTNPTSCLVGSKTFGTGFDVPGDALECVVLWKLPFGKQTPVDEALKLRLGTAWFARHYLPAMLIELKQWVGRLIRTRGDIGVVAILDSQAAGGRYGRDVAGAMPRGIRRAATFDDVAAFLAAARGAR